MAVHANLLGFDGDVWSYIQTLESDISRRLICFVLNGVDRTMDFPELWPTTILDCVYLAAVINDASESGPVILDLLHGAAGSSRQQVNVEPSERIARIAEARSFIDALEDLITRAIVQLVFDICITKAARETPAPVGKFDMLYFSRIVATAFSDHEAVEVILTGQGSRMDWE